MIKVCPNCVVYYLESSQKPTNNCLTCGYPMRPSTVKECVGYLKAIRRHRRKGDHAVSKVQEREKKRLSGLPSPGQEWLGWEEGDD